MERRFLSAAVRCMYITALSLLTAGVLLADVGKDAEYAYKSLFKAGKYTDAITAFTKILTDYPASTAANEANYWIAMSYYSLDKKDDAFTYFTRQIEKAPSNRLTPEAVLWVGQIYQDKKQYDLALTQFSKAASTYPDFATRAKFMIGECYRVQKKYAEAILFLKASTDAAVDASVSKDDYYLKLMKVKLGEVYRESKDWDGATALYTRLIEDYPEEAGGFKLDLATCYMGKKDYEKAIALCNEVAAKYPEYVKDALLKVDDCLGEQKKYDEEINYLDKLYDEHSDFRDEILMRRAIVRSDQKREYVAAIADLEQVASDYPDSSQVPFAKARIIGLTLHGLRNIAGARAMAQEFITQYPDYGQMMFVKGDLATCSMQEGKYLEAAKLYEDTLQYEDPSNYHPFTLYLITSCYKRAGEMTKAKETLDRLIKLYPEDPWTILGIQRFSAVVEGR